MHAGNSCSPVFFDMPPRPHVSPSLHILCENGSDGVLPPRPWFHDYTHTHPSRMLVFKILLIDGHSVK